MQHFQIFQGLFKHWKYIYFKVTFEPIPAAGLICFGCERKTLRLQEFFVSTKNSFKNVIFRCQIYVIFGILHQQAKRSLAKYWFRYYWNWDWTAEPCTHVSFLMSLRAVLFRFRWLFVRMHWNCLQNRKLNLNVVKSVLTPTVVKAVKLESKNLNLCLYQKKEVCTDMTCLENLV